MIATATLRKATWMTLMSILLVAALAQDRPRSPIEPDHAPGEILVRFRDNVDPEKILGQDDLRRLLPENSTRHPVSSLRPGILLLRMGKIDTERANAILARLQRSPHVAAASLNYRRRPARRPDDPLYARQWNLRNRGDNAPLIPGIAGADIGAEILWEKTSGDPHAVVAVMDTGIDYDHPDLAPNIWHNPLEIPGNRIDDDGNRFVDDWMGYDFAADSNGGNDPDPKDTDGHGTHVSGIIAARGDNSRGIAGLAWRTRLLTVKTVRPDGFNYSDDVVEALEYIRMLKKSGTANIVAVNCSFGGTGYSEVEEQAYRETAREGILILTAAGNGGDDDMGDDNDEQPFYPASYDVNGIISVAANGADDRLAEFSNYGARSVDLAAPGDGVFSTVPRGSGRLAQVDTDAGALPALGMEYSGTATGITGFLIPCGLGLSAADFPAEVNGAIALIERGETTFQEKIRLAAAAGARAAVIFNNLPGNFSGTLQAAGNWIPVVSISQESGRRLENLVFSRATVINRAADYDYMSGTSMAAPHVAGTAALLAGLYGNESVSRRVSRLLTAIRSLADLQKKTVSGGRLDLRCLARPPAWNVTARRRRNESLLHTEYLVHITWSRNPADAGEPVSGFRVYQSHPEFRLVAELEADAVELQVRRVSRGLELEYALVPLRPEGRCDAVAFAVVQDE
ncbi:MAG: S8 family serine peptidase [Acidobacteriota bacterium]|jgi:subtilisin family serine protease|nr:S8 family serine peptidase [Acidobacteriota bacterium]